MPDLTNALRHSCSFRAALCTLLLFVTVVTMQPRIARAQAEGIVVPRWTESVVLDTDSAAVKKLGAARDFIAAGQWNDAIELLKQIAEQHGERLAAVSPGRYIGVPAYCDLLLSSLPTDGLRAYRARVDPQARQWFEQGQATRDEESLHKAVRQAFVSSYGDDALLLLGELAWERGELPRARGYWRKLVSPVKPPLPGQTPLVLTYPDARIDPAAIRARLVLCSFLSGNFARGDWELESFAELDALAEGTIAGRTGKLVDIVRDIAAQTRRTEFPPESDTGITFAGNAARNKIWPKAVEVGAPAWSVPLPPRALRSGGNETKTAAQGGGPPYFPVVWKNLVLVCDETTLRGWDVRTGLPLPGSDSSALFVHDPQLGINAQKVAGSPGYTLSIDADVVASRTGLLAVRRFGPVSLPKSSLLNFKLQSDGGRATDAKLNFGPLAADDVDPESRHWMFEGAPLVAGGRMYVALRRSNPQPQLNVACFDVDGSTDRPRWNRKVCYGRAPYSDEVQEINLNLLTLADGKLFFNTNLGAVAALDARDGTVLWVATHPHVEADSLRVFNRRQTHGPNPCLFYDGTVFAAPYDSDNVIAYDAETGIVKWSRELPGHAHTLLGAVPGRLIVAGDQLWGLDIDTGDVLWMQGTRDPEGFGYGRGLLAEDVIYWPTREEIFVVNQRHGSLVRRIHLTSRGETGGNLTLAHGYLLIAGPDRLTAFSTTGGPPADLKQNIARR